MDPAGLDAVRDAVEHLHECRATFVESVPVREEFNGAVVWEGEVQVFDVTGNPKATRAFAWSYALDAASDRRKFVAVLCVPPVDTPRKAVQASIAASYRRTAN